MNQVQERMAGRDSRKSLPAWTYNHEEFFELEKQRIFMRSWQVVCFVEGKLFSQGRLCALASGMVAVASAAEGADELRW